MRLKILHYNVKHLINPAKINIFNNYLLQRSPHIITINSHSIIKQDKKNKIS